MVGQAKVSSFGLGHLAWVMCMFATVSCLENRDVHIQRFSASARHDCKSVFDFVTKPGAPTEINDQRCAIDIGCHSWMPETDGCDSSLGRRVTLGGALTEDKVDAANLLKACVRASACQL